MFNSKFIQEVQTLGKNTDRIYIYGAGYRGHDFKTILEKNGIHVDGFVVTEMGTDNEKDGLPILPAVDIIKDKAAGIVLGMSDIYTMDVIDYLRQEKVDFERVVNGGAYMSEYRGIKGLRTEPFLEITTVVGCRVNCKYCPQNKLVSAYYKANKERKRVLDVTDFQVILSHIPENCVVMFAGMAEPYLNPYCSEILKMACESGRKVRLYTTLQGAKEKDVEEMLKLPLDFVGLHVADKEKNAVIEVNETYYEWVERLVNAKKIDSNATFVDDVTAQGYPDDRVKEICEGKFEIITAVQDRAGNLDDVYANSREKKMTNEKYMCFYCGPLVNNHVVLPDGTVLLCQMDYGMKHILGNLFVNTYDEIREGDELQKIFKAMKGERSGDVLCDSCVCAAVRK